MGFLRWVGTVVISLAVVAASLVLLMFSMCALGGGARGISAVTCTIAAVALAILIAGIYALKEL